MSFSIEKVAIYLEHSVGYLFMGHFWRRTLAETSHFSSTRLDSFMLLLVSLLIFLLILLLILLLIVLLVFILVFLIIPKSILLVIFLLILEVLRLGIIHPVMRFDDGRGRLRGLVGQERVLLGSTHCAEFAGPRNVSVLFVRGVDS